MPTIKPIARPGWSGVEKLDFDFPKSELARLVELIPAPKQLNETETPGRSERISAKLIELRARFQRHLHQDEFGPRRPDQAEGLRFLLKQLEEIAKGAQDEILDRTADGLDSLDSSAHDELFDDACGAGLDITAFRDKVAPKERAKKLAILIKVLRQTINRLSRASGPNKSKSVRILIHQLAAHWKKETEIEPTASSDEAYRTDFEKFAVAATDAFWPSKAWFEAREYLRSPIEKGKSANSRKDHSAAVLQAIRELRKTGSSRRGRPRRG
jgi:hypothetical protein